MKLLIHVIVFAAGVALGIWWGVAHPGEAANVQRLEQKNVYQTQIDVYKQLAKETNDPVKAALYTKDAQDEQAKLDAMGSN